MFKDIQEFLWSESNVGHIERHGVSPDEVEEAFFYDENKKIIEDENHSFEDETRFIVLAKVPSTGRLLKFVFSIEGKFLRIVTAYQCTNDKKLVEIYNK